MGIYRTVRYPLFFLFLILAAVSFAQQEVIVVNFDIGKFALSEAEVARVKRSVVNFDEKVVEKIIIEGYCDDTGSESLNYELSERRAQALYEALAQAGVDITKLNKIAGRGSLAVQNVNDDLDIQRQQNRRAEAHVWFAERHVAEYSELTASIGTKSVEVKLGTRPLIMGSHIATGDRFTLDKVLFVGSRAVILASSYGYLKQFIQELQDRPDVKIKIEGHVCCTKPGKDGWDMDSKKHNLSYTRAKAVFDYLAEHGIEPDRMVYYGLKGEFPQGGDPSLDRRVEIEIIEANQ